MRVPNLCTMALLALACLAQNPAEQFEKAPPDVDEALRARIAKFYQAHVEGKFRAADEMVAEDSKDTFFGMEKPHCTAFSIASITYSDNFTHAVAMVACDTRLMIPMAGPMAVKMPLRSQWKVAGGQWFWYIDPASEQILRTPMGIGKPGPFPPNSASTGAPAPVALETVVQSVKTDRQAVTFNPSAPGTEKVVVTSQLPGEVSLSLEPARLDSIQMTLDREKIAQGQSAVLSIRYNPAANRKPADAMVRILVSPTQQEIPVKIQFEVPASP